MQDLGNYKPTPIRNPKEAAALCCDPEFMAIMRGLARRWRQPESFAEDIAQGTLLVILEKLVEKGEFTENALKRAWVVGRNLVRTENRYQKRHRSCDNDTVTDSLGTSGESDDDPVAYSLGTNGEPDDDFQCLNWVYFFYLLTQEQRHVLFPKRYGLRQEDLAEAYGLSASTFSRARKELVEWVRRIERTHAWYGYFGYMFRTVQNLVPVIAASPGIAPAHFRFRGLDEYGSMLLYPYERGRPPVVAVPSLLPFVSDACELSWAFRPATEDDLRFKYYGPPDPGLPYPMNFKPPIPPIVND